ncbi:CDP-alcohol phosphatidyltransferase family protein [Natrarchaeobaculum aegyptiacum]|uniref:CDP-alcohol phosphatidyltransferase n=1 Tax=Natrarchaeobaculum aegyptiacum TaxID=745377 RepID=A0A2Z2HQH3_9EURY|nr:CDP-alcohol phosphatidyltransferase family protein [Natrarchaeobaculum aegyptiacum]ARS89289.1 hypothetical protein B1756_05710 [Natrarchaeobaculum aegyptiacum]
MTPDERSADDVEGRRWLAESGIDAWVGRWLEAATVLVVLTALVAGGVTIGWRPARTVTFAGWIGFAVAVVVIVAGVTIERTARGGASEPLTIASWITLARGAILACFVGVLGSIATAPGSGVEMLMGGGVATGTAPLGWLPAALFAAAGLLDGVDGTVARRASTETDLGARLDTELDALTTLVGTVAVVALGAASIAVLAVGAARYLYAGSLWWRRRQGRPVRDLPSSRVRAGVSAAVLLGIWLALAPITTAEQSVLLTTAVAVPFLANFLWDWLVVTTRVSR